MEVKKCEQKVGQPVSVEFLMTAYRAPVDATVGRRFRTRRSVMMRRMNWTIVMETRVTAPMRRMMRLSLTDMKQ